MNERAILFFLEIARSSARASISDFGSGRFSSRSSRIFFGTAASTRVSRLSKPTSRSMARTSFSFGPMWRRAKEFGSIFLSRRCMGADYGKRIALQVGQRALRSYIEEFSLVQMFTSRHKSRRLGFSIMRAAQPGGHDFEFRLCKEHSRPRHQGWRRRDRARFV